MPSKSRSQNLSNTGHMTPKAEVYDLSDSIMNDTAQVLQRFPSGLHKTLSSKLTQHTDSIKGQRTPPTPSLRKSAQDLLRQKSSLEKLQQTQLDRSPSLQSRPLTRSNSINPANKDNEKSSSGERS